MYVYNTDKTLSRRTRNIMVAALCALVLLNAVQFFMARTTVTRDAIVRDAFITRIRSELSFARQAASQVSRSEVTSIQPAC